MGFYVEGVADGRLNNENAVRIAVRIAKKCGFCCWIARGLCLGLFLAVESRIRAKHRRHNPHMLEWRMHRLGMELGGL